MSDIYYICYNYICEPVSLRMDSKGKWLVGDGFTLEKVWWLKIILTNELQKRSHAQLVANLILYILMRKKDREVWTLEFN